MLLRPYYRIVLIYLIFAGLWISMSDELVLQLFSSIEMITLAQSVKGYAFVVITSIMLFELIRRDLGKVERANQRLVDSYDQTLQGWIQVMDLRHQETSEHTLRVTRMSVALARVMGIHGRELKYLARGAMMHDVGKIGIPDTILIKPGPLDEAEWQVMKQHPGIAYDLMQKIDYLKPAIDIPYCHHERWNGTGYPRGLKEQQIPLAARIFAIVDVWDALMRSRVYKDAWPEDQVCLYIEQQSGIHFDPDIVAAFLNHYDEIKGTGETTEA